MRSSSTLLALALTVSGCAPDVGAATAAQRRGRPFRDAGAEPDAGSDPGTCCASRDLGALPSHLRGLTWPALPAVRSEVEVETEAALRDALARLSNVRVRVRGAHAGLYVVARSDVEILLEPDAFVEHLLVARSQQRVRISGGTYATIEMMPPIDFPNGGTTPDESLMATDVTIECVTMRAPDTAFLVRGHRVAVLGADVHAERYSFFAGDTEPIQLRDLVVAHSVLRSAGPEPTYRVHSVSRSVVAFTTLANTSKHNFRVHGVSERNYLGDSVLVGTSIMMGRTPGDSLDRVWVIRNVVYYDGTNGIFLTDPTTRRLVATDNVAYSDEPFAPSDPHPSWEIRGNVTHPYEPAPSSVYECR